MTAILDDGSGSPRIDLDALSCDERAMIERIRGYETETARVLMQDLDADEGGRQLVKLLRRARTDPLAELCLRAVERTTFAWVFGDEDTAWQRLRIESALVRDVRRVA